MEGEKEVYIFYGCKRGQAEGLLLAGARNVRSGSGPNNHNNFVLVHVEGLK